MVGERDGAAGALVLAHGEVLVERSSSLDGWGVGAGSFVNIVHTAIGSDSAKVGASRARVVGTVGLNNVVLNKGVRGPPIQSDQAITTGADGASV